MSAGAVFQEVLRVFNRQHLPEVSQLDVLAALEAGRDHWRSSMKPGWRPSCHANNFSRALWLSISTFALVT